MYLSRNRKKMDNSIIICFCCSFICYALYGLLVNPHFVSYEDLPAPLFSFSSLPLFSFSSLLNLAFWLQTETTSNILLLCTPRQPLRWNRQLLGRLWNPKNRIHAIQVGIDLHEFILEITFIDKMWCTIAG